MELIERIKLARERADLNQSDLAGLMGITPQAVQNWEYGKTAPKLSRLKKLAQVLEVSEEWLITGQGAINKKVINSADDQKTEDEIISILSQLDGQRREDAISLLKSMLKQQKILSKYGI